MKSLYDQFKQEFMASDVEYCCYCMEPKDGKVGCCYENHFINFRDFDESDQQHIINSEIEASFGVDQ